KIHVILIRVITLSPYGVIKIQALGYTTVTSRTLPEGKVYFTRHRRDKDAKPPPCGAGMENFFDKQLCPGVACWNISVMNVMLLRRGIST
ncbi:hypothetical protein CE195_04245, partial [Sodalis-like symbiont of Philaenus spumarius]